ncbi:hypothetical protein [Bdellovibrio bacteriovorus]|uniref:hypothetical protein n=1 Tax=Bdellovibrio bacteriovorus TaxID=959 RepID=UPI003D05467A
MNNLALIMLSVFSINALIQKSEAAQLNPADLVGQYRGTCSTEGGQISEQALFIQPFQNADGVTNILPISTELFYDGALHLPNEFAYLLKADDQALIDVAYFVREGLSGTDNNLKYVSAGTDFKHLYTAEVQGDSFVLQVSRTYGHQDDNTFRNPPELRGCRYGRHEGRFVYQFCYKSNDRTVYTVTANGLTSVRTADAIGNPTNNHSFSLSAVDSTCNWAKVK